MPRAPRTGSVTGRRRPPAACPTGRHRRAPPDSRPDGMPSRPLAVPRRPGATSPSCRSAITPNPRQPRQVFDEEALAELVALDPRGRAAAAGRGPAARVDGRYELIMGERRWRAAQAAGLTAIPAIVRDDRRRRHAARRAAGEPAPQPAQPAGGGRRLRPAARRTSAAPTTSWPRRIGRSRPQISNTLRLLQLPPAGAAPGRRRRAVRRARPRAARPRGRRGAGAAGAADRRRGAVGAVGRGDRRARRRASRRRAGAHAAGRTRPSWRTSPSRLSDRFETRVKVDLGPAQGPDHRGVRLDRRPGADRGAAGPRSTLGRPSR